MLVAEVGVGPDVCNFQIWVQIYVRAKSTCRTISAFAYRQSKTMENPKSDRLEREGSHYFPIPRKLLTRIRKMC